MTTQYSSLEQGDERNTLLCGCKIFLQRGSKWLS